MNQVYTKEELRSAPPLSLSFIGDAVHTLFVREGHFSVNLKNNALHAVSSEDCCAPRQAKAAKKMEELLDEDELCIFKRGKNAKVNTVPKNCTLYEYNLATAFEAVIGYLYLLAEYDRMEELIRASYAE